MAPTNKSVSTTTATADDKLSGYSSRLLVIGCAYRINHPSAAHNKHLSSIIVTGIIE